jgi:hypothetical protein
LGPSLRGFGWNESGLALAAGSEKPHTIAVSEDFLVKYIVGKGIDSSKNELLIGVQIYDQGNNVNVFDDYVPLDKIAGDAKQPFIVPLNWQLRANTNLNIKIKNLEASTALDRIDLMFLGEKL